MQAAWDLGHDLKAYSAIPDLAQALKDKNPLVRCNAAASLWAMADHAQSVQAELREALNDSYSRVRLNAAMALWTMGVAKTDLFPVLIDISAGPDLVDAVNAADLEITIGKDPKDVIPVLMRGMADPEVSETVISNVVTHPRDIAYLPVFLAGANSANYEIRYKSINNLATDTYASREVSAVIRSATSDPVGSVREIAIESLVANGEGARWGAVEGSADRTAGETMALLMTLLSDPDAGIRSTAVETLSRTQTSDPAVIAALAKHLKDPDYDVRTAAATAMGLMKISTPEVIAALVVCLKEPDRYTVKLAAATALGEIGKPAIAAAPALLAIYQEIRRIARSKGENPDSDFSTDIYHALLDTTAGG